MASAGCAVACRGVSTLVGLQDCTNVIRMFRVRWDRPIGLDYRL